MVRCPRCGEEIDYLTYKGDTHFGGTFSLEDGYDQDDEDYGSTGCFFYCPDCGEQLLEGETEAMTFLSKKKKGEI